MDRRVQAEERRGMMISCIRSGLPNIACIKRHRNDDTNHGRWRVRLLVLLRLDCRRVFLTNRLHHPLVHLTILIHTGVVDAVDPSLVEED